MARKHEDKWRLFQRAGSHPALAESTRIEVLIAMGRVAGKLQPVPAGNSALEKEMGDKTDRLPRRTAAPLSCNNHLQDSGRSARSRFVASIRPSPASTVTLVVIVLSAPTILTS